MSERRTDFIFGIVAFDPRVGCVANCAAHREGVRRWSTSIRRHTRAASVDVALFTGEGRGSIAASAATAHVLRRAEVRTIEGDFRDSPSRVAHSDGNKYMWCVVRNRWFVVRDYLRAHFHEYRSVLMMDVRDAIVQADPFAWVPRGHLAAGFDQRRTVVFSGEGSGSVKVLAQSPKGRQRTLECAGEPPLDERARERLLATDPLNAGVTLGGAAAFLNFSAALADVVSRVTTPRCLAVKDCTDQGLYNVLVYAQWEQRLPHTRRLIVPMEGGAPSYTLGHKKGRVLVDGDGRLRDDTHHYIPPVVHQFAKGAAGRALRRTRFAAFLTELLDAGTALAGATAMDSGRLSGGGEIAVPTASQSLPDSGTLLACHQCLMADSTASPALASFCARRCEVT